MGGPPDKEMMAERKKVCEKSEIFNVFICEKRPDHERALKAHRKLKKLLRNF